MFDLIFNLICLILELCLILVFIFKNIGLKEIRKGKHFSTNEKIGLAALVFTVSWFKIILFMIIEKI